MTNSRVLMAVALLAVLGLAHAASRPTPKPAPKPAPKQNVQDWCDKSTPPKCGTWAKDKVCAPTCANGGACSLQPPTGKAKPGPAPGQCCKCRTEFGSQECNCGGTTPETASYCSSDTPAADNTCAICQLAICDSVCADGTIDPIGYVYDGKLDLVDPLAASCPHINYDCPACNADPCADCGGTDETATYCSSATDPASCAPCKDVICAAVCADATIDPSLGFLYDPNGSLVLGDQEAAGCPAGPYLCTC